MHPADIRAALAKRGVTQEKLIEGTPFDDRSYVSHVIHGRRFCQELHEKIAHVTGKSLHELWPQYYTRDNKPRKRVA